MLEFWWPEYWGDTKQMQTRKSPIVSFLVIPAPDFKTDRQTDRQIELEKFVLQRL